MKKTFMIMAAMLLISVSAFAQSGETPLKGDVNEDGVVDVSDITAVIGIIKNVQEHFFYLGTVKPTAENYKIIPGATTSYISFDEAAGTTISVDAGQTLYMLCPAQWVKGKTVVLEDNSGETLNFSEEIDYTTVSGYAIYKTQVLTDAKDITLKGQETYYWYVGYNQDAYDNPQGFKSNMYTTTTNSMPTEYTKTGDNGLNVATTGTTPNYLIMIIPSSWNKPVIYGQYKDGEITMTLEKQNISITGISGVTFNVYSGTGEISDSKVFIN